MRPLVWFRSDLRLRDNSALSEACRLADDAKAIHAPHERAPDALKGVAYPEPLVDLRKSRQDAIARFKAVMSR